LLRFARNDIGYRGGVKRIAVVSLLLASSLLAHDTFLLPLRFSAAPDHGVGLDLTSGMAFPQLEYPIKAPRVARAIVRCGREAGVAAVVVELKPKSLELNAKQIAEYVEEIGAQWALKNGKKRWREEYVKHTKTYIRATKLRPSSKPNLEWESDFTTMTLGL
jgi:hypothetical protein